MADGRRRRGQGRLVELSGPFRASCHQRTSTDLDSPFLHTQTIKMNNRLSASRFRDRSRSLEPCGPVWAEEGRGRADVPVHFACTPPHAHCTGHRKGARQARTMSAWTLGPYFGDRSQPPGVGVTGSLPSRSDDARLWVDGPVDGVHTRHMGSGRIRVLLPHSNRHLGPLMTGAEEGESAGGARRRHVSSHSRTEGRGA